MPEDTEPMRPQPPDITHGQSPYFAPDYPPPGSKSKKAFVIVPLIIVLLAGLGYGGWKLLKSHKTVKPAANSAVQTATVPTSKDVPDVAGTLSYENGPLGFKLTYPSNWTATEAADKSGVRLESPTFNYQTVSKGQVSGNFRVYIRQGARPVDDSYIGRGYAIAPSQKLTYSTPALGQRADTNLSLFGLDTPDNFAFFLIAGNFQLNKGDTLGPKYGTEQGTYIIGGGFSSKSLTDDLATNVVSPTLLQTSNAYKQALTILKSLQLN